MPHVLLTPSRRDALLLGVASALFSLPAQADSPLQSTIGGPSAGPASATPAALFWNPASLSRLPDNQLYGELNGSWRLGRYTRELTDGGSAEAATQFSLDAQPMVAATRRLQDTGLTVGFGVFAPYLDRTRWRGEDSQARWHAIDSGVRTLALTPAMSYQLTPRLSIGASAQLTRVNAYSYRAVDYGQIVAEQRDRDDIPHEAAGNEGRALLTFKGNAGVLAGGLSWQPDAATVLGLSFTSGSEVNIQGKYSAYSPRNAYFSADFGDREDATARLMFNLPQALRAGVERATRDTLTLRAGLDLVRWAALDQITVDASPEAVAGITSPDLLVAAEWRNALVARLGFSHRSSEEVAWHGALAYESNPISEERLTPALLYGNSADLSLSTTRVLRSGHTLEVGYRQRVMIPRTVTESADMRHSTQGNYAAFLGMIQLSYTWELTNRESRLPEVVPADSFTSSPAP